jgi:hypothetical protein
VGIKHLTVAKPFQWDKLTSDYMDRRRPWQHKLWLKAPLCPLSHEFNQKPECKGEPGCSPFRIADRGQIRLDRVMKSREYILNGNIQYLIKYQNWQWSRIDGLKYTLIYLLIQQIFIECSLNAQGHYVINQSGKQDNSINGTRKWSCTLEKSD